MKCEYCNSELDVPDMTGMDMNKIYKTYSVSPRYYCKSCKRKDKRLLTDEDLKKWKILNKIED